MKDAIYFAENPDQFQQLTEQQQEQLFEHGFLDLDDGENGSGSPATDETAAGDKTDTDADDNGEGEEPVVMGKSGKHTIPYEVLETTRHENATLKEQLRQQQQFIEQLKAAQAQDQKDGGTDAQEAVIKDYDGLFPDIFDDLNPHLQSIVEKKVAAALGPMTAKLQEIQRKETDLAIQSAHPDVKEIINDDKFDQWVAENEWIIDKASKQPMRVLSVLRNGQADQINEVLRQHKEALGIAAEKRYVPDSRTIADKVKSAIEGAKTPVPGTMSDLPSGQMAKHDPLETFLNMSDSEREAAMFKMTPDQREQLLAKML